MEWSGVEKSRAEQSSGEFNQRSGRILASLSYSLTLVAR